MPLAAAGERGRTRIRRHGSDVYPLALAAIAVACLLTTVAILIIRPQWDSLVLDLPLGAYLMGGAGGLLSIVLHPGWSRRLGSRHRARVVLFTLYRLGCASLMGGVGFLALPNIEHLIGLFTPDWVNYAFSLAAGLVETPANEIVLRALGFLAPREIDPRLL
jgi:hypothetical protein